MSPPDLPTDTPVLDVVHPLVVSLLPLRRDNFGIAALNRLNRLFCQRSDSHIPLFAHVRFDNGFTTIAFTDGVCVIVNRFQQTLLFQVGNYILAGLVTFLPLVGATVFVDVSRLIQHVDEFQSVPLADFKVIEIMSRGNFYRTGTKFHIDILVGNDRDLPINQRQQYGLSDQLLIAFVFRINSYGSITEHRFRAGGRNDQVLIGPLDRVTQVPEVALLIIMFNLKIRKGGMATRTPVDQPVITVDQAVLIKPHERLTNRPRKAGVHSKTLTLPVTGSAKTLQLIDDLPARFLTPLPNPLDKLITPQIVTILTFAGQLFFHHILGGNPGVVGARHPENLMPGHPFPATENILQGVVESVSHVQDTGDIRWRDNDGIMGFI